MNSLPSNISYEDIRVMFHTGKYIRDYSSGDKKNGKYRAGVMTKLGDIEEQEWILKAEELIHQNNEWEAFEQLKQWYRKTTPWIKDRQDLHRYALECFIARIHENHEWVDYNAFNTQYRLKQVDDLQ